VKDASVKAYRHKLNADMARSLEIQSSLHRAA